MLFLNILCSCTFVLLLVYLELPQGFLVQSYLCFFKMSPERVSALCCSRYFICGNEYCENVRSSTSQPMGMLHIVLSLRLKLCC